MPLALIQQSVAQRPQLLQPRLGQPQPAPAQSPQMQSQASPHPSQFLQLERHMAQASAVHTQQQQQQQHQQHQQHQHQQQQQLLQQNPEALKLDGGDPSKPLQLTSKDHFDPSDPQDPSKSQFVSLTAVCFPESMLLGDERNLFPGVDDVFSAAGECGVNPQPEFGKPAGDESGIQPADVSKSGFQAMRVRHVPAAFHASRPPQPPALTEQQSLHALTLSNNNNHQMNLNLEGDSLEGSAQQPKSVSHDQPQQQQQQQQCLGGSDHHMQPGLTSTQSLGDQGGGGLKRRDVNPESEEENDDVPDDGAINNAKDPDFVPSGKSNTDESAVSDVDYNQGDEATAGSGNKRKLKRPIKPRSKLDSLPEGWPQALPEEEGALDSLQDGNQKKRKGKVRLKDGAEEDGGGHRPAKRSAPGKRPNSKDSNSSHDSYYDSYHQQERIKQKIREVEEKQPEVKSGFIASFLDFLKSGPKQQFPAPSVRTTNRSRKPSANAMFPPPAHPQQLASPAVAPAEGAGSASPCKRLDDDLKKNLEALPSFSSDEEDSVGRNHDLQKSISSALSVLDDPADKKEKRIKTESTAEGATSSVSVIQQGLAGTNPSPPSKEDVQEPAGTTAGSLEQKPRDDLNPAERATKQESVAIEGSTDEEDIESGGEGMYRERDEFVVKIEDITALQMALKTGREPPAIWKVQKALLQKFMPEVKDGRRQFSATNSYLGYFGDAKNKYKRVYVKYIENVNKKDYVRVCSKKPRNRPLQTLRHSHSRSSSGNKASVGNSASHKGSSAKSKAKPAKPVKQAKTKAEPPPKKRKKWIKQEHSSPSDSSPETQSEEDDTAFVSKRNAHGRTLRNAQQKSERSPATPYVARFLNTRTMKETFKNYLELLVSTALDPDMIEASEKSNDELYLPHMRKIDGMLNETKKRMISKFPLESALKTVLENLPDLTTGGSGAKSSNPTLSKVKMSGKSYNKKTLQPVKQGAKGPKEFTVDSEKLQCCTLYHSLHHYKYHVYLICKKETVSILKQNKDLGQVDTIQQCMENQTWVENLFENFGDLLTQAQQKCL